MRNSRSLVHADGGKIVNAGIPAWMTTLREAAFNAVKAEDIQAIVQKQVEKAKSGDPQAVKLVFDLFLGGSKPPQSMTQNNLIIEADAPLSESSTKARRGTSEKVEVMAQRIHSGRSAFHPNDE